MNFGKKRTGIGRLFSGAKRKKKKEITRPKYKKKIALKNQELQWTIHDK